MTEHTKTSNMTTPETQYWKDQHAKVLIKANIAISDIEKREQRQLKHLRTLRQQFDLLLIICSLLLLLIMTMFFIKI